MVKFAKVLVVACLVGCGSSVVLAVDGTPKAPGEMVDLGGHRLHVNCVGSGVPTVLVENGLGDFSFDWVFVQSQVAHFTRICTYDRAGYAWSDPGPKPRSFAQLNLELRDALGKLREHGPFVLVGHSFGGPVVRNFEAVYPKDVAGMVLVDAAFEGQRVGIGGGKTIRLGASAKGMEIPHPREEMRESDKVPMEERGEQKQAPLDAMYKVLPKAEQEMQLWAQAMPQMDDAEASQREWSEEYFAKWLRATQAGVLGQIPLVVLTRAEGGSRDGSDIPAAQLERERREGQAALALLSKDGKQVIVKSGHNMELEAPDAVVSAIRDVVERIRGKKPGSSPTR